MDALTALGLIATAAMLGTHILERASHWMILGFGGSCALASIYAFLRGAWPFGVVEAGWGALEVRRWVVVRTGRS